MLHAYDPINLGFGHHLDLILFISSLVSSNLSTLLSQSLPIHLLIRITLYMYIYFTQWREGRNTRRIGVSGYCILDPSAFQSPLQQQQGGGAGPSLFGDIKGGEKGMYSRKTSSCLLHHCSKRISVSFSNHRWLGS